jgi:hypothetical protein
MNGANDRAVDLLQQPAPTMNPPAKLRIFPALLLAISALATAYAQTTPTHTVSVSELDPALTEIDVAERNQGHYRLKVVFKTLPAAEVREHLGKFITLTDTNGVAIATTSMPVSGVRKPQGREGLNLTFFDEATFKKAAAAVASRETN